MNETNKMVRRPTREPSIAQRRAAIKRRIFLALYFAAEPAVRRSPARYTELLQLAGYRVGSLHRAHVLKSALLRTHERAEAFAESLTLAGLSDLDIGLRLAEIAHGDDSRAALGALRLAMQAKGHLQPQEPGNQGAEIHIHVGSGHQAASQAQHEPITVDVTPEPEP